MLQCVSRSDQIILESFIKIFFNEKTFTFRKDLSHPQVARGQPDDRGFVQLGRDGRRKRKEFSEFEKFGVFFLAAIARSIFALVFHSKLKCYKLKVRKPQKSASIKNDKVWSVWKFCIFFLATIASSIFALVFHSKQKRSVKIELKSKFS